eukprot:243781-Chlamydomonas_euryale.AAC.1
MSAALHVSTGCNRKRAVVVHGLLCQPLGAHPIAGAWSRCMAVGQPHILTLKRADDLISLHQGSAQQNSPLSHPHPSS